MNSQRKLPQGCKPWGSTYTKNIAINDIKKAINSLVFYTGALNRNFSENKQWVDGGICPFHDDSHAGSFRINLVSGAFRCFSCGTSGGDVIDFTQKLHGLSFHDAITKLANEWGVLC